MKSFKDLWEHDMGRKEFAIGVLLFLLLSVIFVCMAHSAQAYVLPSVEELETQTRVCEILQNDLYHCSDGWTYNEFGYKLIHDDLLMHWALSSNRALVDMSRAWQNTLAEGYEVK